jgi:hypothetical protein
LKGEIFQKCYRISVQHRKLIINQLHLLQLVHELIGSKFWLHNFCRGAQLNEALLMQMEVHRRLSDQLVVAT